jgi:hypothetical protein
MRQTPGCAECDERSDSNDRQVPCLTVRVEKKSHCVSLLLKQFRQGESASIFQCLFETVTESFSEFFPPLI